MYTDLLPITALMRRELLTSLRQQRFFLLGALCTFIAAVVTILQWPRANAMPWEMVARSEQTFFFTTFTLAIGTLLGIPALAGSSIVTEREEETFELLAMTTARPWHVLLAKLFNAAGHFMMLLVALMPIAAASYFLVGLNITALWQSLLAIASAALVSAAAGVVCSAMSQRPMVGVGLSFLSMIVLIGLPYLLLCVVLDLLGLADGDDSIGFGAYFAPVCAYFSESVGGDMEWYAPIVCAALCILLSLVCVLIAHAVLRRSWGTGPRTTTAKTSRRSRPVAMHNFGNAINPVFLRDRWFDYHGQQSVRAFLVGLPFILSLSATTLIVIMAETTGRESGIRAFTGWNILQAVLLSVLLAALTGNVFTKERERGNMDALRMSLQTNWEIITGKLMVTLYVALLLFISALLGTFPMLFATSLDDGFLAVHFDAAHIMLAECLLMVSAISCCASLLAKKTSGAIVLSLATGFFVLFGNYFVVVLGLIAVRFINDQTVRFAMAFSPLLTYVRFMNGNRPIMGEVGMFAFSAVIAVLVFLNLCWICETAYRRRCARDI